MHTNSAISARIPAAVALRELPTCSLPLRPTAGQPRMLAKGEELFAEGDPADYFFKVVSGSIRTCKLLSDGRRQIDAFHLPGDIFASKPGLSTASPPKRWAMPPSWPSAARAWPNSRLPIRPSPTRCSRR
jgi:CRP-like cAMP-binding protein